MEAAARDDGSGRQWVHLTSCSGHDALAGGSLQPGCSGAMCSQCAQALGLLAKSVMGHFMGHRAGMPLPSAALPPPWRAWLGPSSKIPPCVNHRDHWLRLFAPLPGVFGQLGFGSISGRRPSLSPLSQAVACPLNPFRSTGVAGSCF